MQSKSFNLEQFAGVKSLLEEYDRLKYLANDYNNAHLATVAQRDALKTKLDAVKLRLGIGAGPYTFDPDENTLYWG